MTRNNEVEFEDFTRLSLKCLSVSGLEITPSTATTRKQKAWRKIYFCLLKSQRKFGFDALADSAIIDFENGIYNQNALPDFTSFALILFKAIITFATRAEISQVLTIS